jgi:chromosome segregation ATPase
MNTLLAVAGFVLALITSLGSLGVVVYRLGQVKGQFDAFAKTVIEAVSEMKEMRNESKREAAKSAVQDAEIATLKADHVETRRQVKRIHEKVFSHDKHIAVTREQIRQSRPDLGGTDD